MTLTALSSEKRAFDRLADLSRNGLTNAGFCRLLALQGETSMGASKLSQCLAGIKNFENTEGLGVLKLLDELISLRDSYAPLPISLRDPNPIAPLLEERRRLRRDVPEPVIFSVGINGDRHYFVEKNNVGDLIFTLAAAMAATMPRAVAVRIAEALTALGYADVTVVANPLKGMNGLHTTFESLMRLPESEDDQVIAISSEFEAQ